MIKTLEKKRKELSDRIAQFASSGLPPTQVKKQEEPKQKKKALKADDIFVAEPVPVITN